MEGSGLVSFGSYQECRRAVVEVFQEVLRSRRCGERMALLNREWRRCEGSFKAVGLKPKEAREAVEECLEVAFRHY